MMKIVSTLSVFLFICLVSVNSKESSEDPATEEVDPDDLVTLRPFLLQISIVPTVEDEEAIGSGNHTDVYKTWVTSTEAILKRAFEKANMDAKNAEEPIVKIVKIDLVKEEESSKNVKIQFYITMPPKGRIAGSVAEEIYRKLSTVELWDDIGREVLEYPRAIQPTEAVPGSSRTLSIIAFIMGWVCLAALIVILAYLGIKYRDGIKSLARRIEHWSNPNRNGYSNLGGDVHASDWRTETDTRGPYDELEREEAAKPKKKLRAPGGLLTDAVEEAEQGTAPATSYGTYESNPNASIETQIKESAQVRLSDLAHGGDVTPPMTPTSMQKHLIKKYQEKQVEEATRGATDEPLTATNSEVFPDDFADCVEEEEIFQVKP